MALVGWWCLSEKGNEKVGGRGGDARGFKQRTSTVSGYLLYKRISCFCSFSFCSFWAIHWSMERCEWSIKVDAQAAAAEEEEERLKSRAMGVEVGEG